MNDDIFTSIRNINQNIRSSFIEDNEIKILSGTVYDRKNEFVDISIRLRHTIVNDIYFVPKTNLDDIINVINKIGRINYISTTIPYIYATIPLNELDTILKNPNVEDVTIEAVYETQDVSSKNLSSLESSVNIPVGEAVDSINVRALWDKGLTGKGIRIGMIDTGIDTDPTKPYSSLFLMPDSTSKVIHSKAFGIDIDKNGVMYPAPNIDRVGHGTATAACAAGRVWKSSVGDIYGSAPDALLIDANVVSKVNYPNSDSYMYTIYQRDIIKAGDWLLSSDVGGVDIINMSVGTAIETEDMRTMIENFYKNGIVTIASAGNDGPGIGSVASPSSVYKSICIGSIALKTNNYNGAATFSSRGPVKGGYIKPDFLAPGGNIEKDVPMVGIIGGNEFFYLPDMFLKDSTSTLLNAGTSFSSPIATGMFACMLQDVNIRANKKLSHIVSRAEKDNHKGFGIIDSLNLYDEIKSLKESSNIMTIRLFKFDPYIAKKPEETGIIKFFYQGIYLPTPYEINSNEIVYYLNPFFSCNGVGAVVYDPVNKKYINKRKVIDSCCIPGIVYYNNKYYAFYYKFEKVKEESVYKGVYYTVVSESDDGIKWVNERRIDTSLIDSYENIRLRGRYSAQVINNKIYIYIARLEYLRDSNKKYKVKTCKGVFLYDKIYSNVILVCEVDLNNLKIVSKSVAYNYSTTNKLGNTQIVLAPYVTYNNVDKKYYMYLTLPTSCRHFTLIETVSDNGFSFKFNRFIDLNQKSYNSYNGICFGVLFNNKLYYSNGWEMDVVFGHKPKIYADDMNCGHVPCSFKID